jgi:hypothetical protein
VVLHAHVVEGAEAGGLVAGLRLRLALGGAGRRWGRRAGRRAVGGGQGLLHGLLEQRLQVGLGDSGRWRLLRLGGVRFARCGTLRGTLFASFDDLLQGGEGSRDAALQFGIVNAA